MSESLTNQEYEQIVKLLKSIQPNVEETTTIQKKLVGQAKPAYQFDFNKDNQTGTIQIDDQTYNFIFTKSYYGQIVMFLKQPAINDAHLTKLKSIQTQLTKYGYGMINLLTKSLLPNLNTAIQKSNFKFSNHYWEAEINYEQKTLSLNFNQDTGFEINWQYGFYYNHHRMTGQKFNENNHNPLIAFPMDAMLEVSLDEYSRLTKLTKN